MSFIRYAPNYASRSLFKRKDAISQVPNLRIFLVAVTKVLGGEGAKQVGEATALIYTELIRDRSVPENGALQFHLDKFILSGLSLYRALQESGVDQERAVALVDQAFELWAIRARSFLRIPGRLPFYFFFMRLLTRRILTAGFPEEGWKIEWEEVSRERIAFNMASCYYLDILNSYGAPELVPLYCRVDDVVFETFSPYIQWNRTKTLGRGHECCNFEFSSRGGAKQRCGNLHTKKQ